MKCPNCGKTNTIIIDTRNSNGKVNRKRSCLDCKKMFFTVETLDIGSLFVSAANFKKRGCFKRQKLLSSIMKVVYDSDIPAREITEFVDSIEFGEVRDYTTDELFKKVCDFLKERDYKAYVRYAIKRKNFVLEDDKSGC